MSFATRSGKEHAQAQLYQRIKKNEGREERTSVDPRTGLPSYCYCKICKDEIRVLENSLEPTIKLCAECNALEAHDWLEKHF